MSKTKDGHVSRRSFLKVAAGASAFPFFWQRNSWAAPASEKIIVAHIGLGGMGNAHLNWFAHLPDVEIAALCDVDRTHLATAMKRLKQMRPESNAKGYSDFREVLDRKDIDAITCATPDHWHALIAIGAFQASKDVYGEKPLSYSVAEGKAMLRAARRYGRVFELGTQIHSTENYHRVVEIIRADVIGKVHTVRLWRRSYSPGMGYPPNENPPATLDWNMWLGPAPLVPYTPARCHRTFRYFLDYSGGVYADFWCHIADIAFWALDPGEPRVIEARGEPPENGIADAPRWIDVDFQFDNLKMFWTTEPPDLPGAKKRAIGACFEGSHGSLLCDYTSREIYIDGKQLTEEPDIPKTLPRSPGHQRDFIQSIKSRKPPESHLAYARKMTLPMQLGLISYKLRRKLLWNPETESFVGDDAANRLLDRPCRAPWHLSRT